MPQVIRAQDPAPSAQSQETQSQSPKDTAQNPTTSSTTETKDEEKTAKAAEEKKKKEEKKAHRGAFVVAPLPIVSPAIGSGIVPVVGYIFPLQVNKEHPEPSVIGVAGLGTNNGTRGFGIGGDVYLKEARYEIKSVYVHGNIDYNLYGVGYVNANAGLKLPLAQTGQVFFIEFLRNIGWDFYVGGRFVTGNSFITIKQTEGGPLPPIPPGVGLQTDLRALGMEVVRDSRPNRFYPVKGSLVDFTGDFFANSLGSKYSFQSYKFTFNKYASLNSKQVLAYNLFFVAQAESHRFTEIAFMARTTNCADTPRDAISITICWEHSWSTDWSCLGGSAWLPLAAWEKWRLGWTNSEGTISSLRAAQAYGFC
ncbi:MAG: hypothetical protein WBQ59_08915 [Candidatus Acidiferrum sp.]